LTVAPLELRRYDAFQAVSVPLFYDEGESTSLTYTLQNMGTALTEIFSYLELGDNTESALMSMTAPFFISDRTTGENKKNSKMFAKLPQDRAMDPPCPTDLSRVEIIEFPETVLASLSFAGICTDEEINRQKDKLIERIEEQQAAADIGWKIRENADDDEQPEFLILQYNAPGTLPWRRMNEIAVVMEKSDNEQDDASSSKDESTAADEAVVETVKP